MKSIILEKHKLEVKLYIILSNTIVIQFKIQMVALEEDKNR